MGESMGDRSGQVLYEMIGLFSAFRLNALSGQVLYERIGLFSAFRLNLPRPTHPPIHETESSSQFPPQLLNGPGQSVN
jgi:hypothetical protein